MGLSFDRRNPSGHGRILFFNSWPLKPNPTSRELTVVPGRLLFRRDLSEGASFQGLRKDRFYLLGKVPQIQSLRIDSSHVSLSQFNVTDLILRIKPSEP
jgi:hypothetical protein